MRYFDGYLRDDGRVGTRNYVAIISGVNCSASVSQFVKDKFRDVSRDYPNIDGVLAVTHKAGCGTELFGEDHMALQRVLAGYAKHPNVAAYILVGLGCEVNQAAVMVDKQRMAAPGHPERKPMVINIQEAGGIRKTVDKAAAEVAKLLPAANSAKRTKQPVSEITLATNCGGSDSNSGITANPALGWAVDKPVPYIKLATNSLMYRHMQEDMDINCGVILEGTPLPEVGRQIFEEIVAVASGKRSKSELSGVGEEEFAPWIIGPVM